MKEIRITIEAATQFHNGEDYEFYPALEIKVTDETGNQLLIPWKGDIHGAGTHSTIATAQTEAEIYLTGRVKAIGRAIIKDVGE